MHSQHLSGYSGPHLDGVPATLWQEQTTLPRGNGLLPFSVPQVMRSPGLLGLWAGVRLWSKSSQHALGMHSEPRIRKKRLSAVGVRPLLTPRTMNCHTVAAALLGILLPLPLV